MSDVDGLSEESWADVEELEDCWIDVLAFTKKDWDTIEILAGTLKMQNAFRGDDFKCIVGALALFVDSGKGIREATQ